MIRPAVHLLAVPWLLLAGCGGDPGTGPEPGPAAALVELHPDYAVVEEGAHAEPFQATVRGADGEVLADVSLEWTSTAAGVAGVDAGGRVEGRGRGQADIVASAGSVSGRARLVVAGPADPVATAFVGGAWTASVVAGEEVRVPVLLDLERASPGGDLGATRVRVDYDPALLELAAASGASGFTAVFNTAEPGRAIAALVRTSPVGTGVFALVELTFRVAAGATPGTAGTVGLSFTEPLTSTSFAVYAEPIAVDGRFVVR